MRDINLYIVEKLHLNKDIHISDNINIKKMLNIISDYIISNTYLGKWTCTKTCDVKEIDTNRIEIFIEDESRKSFWNIIGKNICEKIKNELHIYVTFSTAIDDNKIFINIEDEKN